jgi:MFS family permease
MQNSGSIPPEIGFKALLKNRAFLILWVGQIVSQVADKIFLVLLIALALQYRDPPFAENTMRSSVMIANTLPAVFLGSAAGLFIDRWSTKQVLWLSNFLRGVIVLLIPALAHTNFFWLLLIAGMESVLTQFFAPAEQAAIPIVVKEHNLMTANALFTSTMMGAFVVGFAVGEPMLALANNLGERFDLVMSGFTAWEPIVALIHYLGDSFREILVGGLYLLAALVLLLVPMRERKSHLESLLHPWKDFQQGLRYLKNHPRLSNAMLQLTVLYCVLAALLVLAFGLAEELGLAETQGGFLLAAAGVGLILGAGILGQWGDRWRHLPLTLVGFCVVGATLVGSALNHRLWLGLVLSVGLGVGGSFIGVPMQTLLQVETPSEMRGKMFGFQNNVINIALCFPLVVTGLLADLSLRGVLGGLGGLVWIIGIWTWRHTHMLKQGKAY